MASLAGAEDFGGPEESWSDMVRSYSTNLESTDLVFVDYASGEPVLTMLEMQIDVKLLGVTGRFPAGMGSVGSSGIQNPQNILVYESPSGNIGLCRFNPSEPEVTFGGPGEDLQPEIFGDAVIAYARENAEGGYDIALHTATRDVTLDLGQGDELWPTFFYAPSHIGCYPEDYDPFSFDNYFKDPPPLKDPLDLPVVLIFQGNPDGRYQLYYAVLGPGAEVLAVEPLLDFPGEAMCPDIPNHHGREVGLVDGGGTWMAFHGLVDGNRDIYLVKLTFHGDPENPAGWSLGADNPRRLTDDPADDKFPELYTTYPYPGHETVWCFFSSNRDGDYDLYAVSQESGKLYQLTDLPGTQTAPLVLTSGR